MSVYIKKNNHLTQEQIDAEILLKKVYKIKDGFGMEFTVDFKTYNEFNRMKTFKKKYESN